ncbi:hypothetical protein [Marinigracilibium pacificum]|uniref:Uncharacterized protein n=1 Tax=Marinigracilibium pacificum TaxID=2729599 RepID=A0A848J434_9BACT|nr:hypothetical protein [Marinigracilibium pacificum]NMM50491.1 hypothetical protein [Marinigracilibium pacificum]
MKERLDQYELLSLKYSQLLSNDEIPELEKRNIRQELAMIDRFKDDLKWKELTGDEKQQKRILSLQKMKRWDSESGGKQKSLVYCENVIDLYDQVIRAIAELENGDKLKNPSLLRIYSILVIERDLINEKSGFDQMVHMDYYVFKNVMGTSQEANFKELKDSFNKMYFSWENRPYKEVSL